MYHWYVAACAFMLGATSLVHSALGEKLLIGPLLRERAGMLASRKARGLIRFSWHLVSAVWALLALILLALAFRPAADAGIALGATGALFTAIGLYDAYASRGRHVGWPMLTAIGLLAFAAAFSVPA